MGLKESGLRGSLRSTSSVLPAFFDVTITNTNSPVQEGDILTVDYSADNTGDAQDTQDIRLEIDSVEEDRDSDITLLGAQSTTGTLEWDTTNEDVATYTATVLSDDDTDSVTVEIEPLIFDSAIHRWTFSEGGGTTAADSIGDADLTLDGVDFVSNNWVDDYAGDGDGSGDDFAEVDIPDWGSQLGDGFTVAVTIETTDNGGIWAGTNDADDNGPRIEWGVAQNGPSNRPDFRIQEVDSGTEFTVYHGDDVNDGDPHRVVFTAPETPYDEDDVEVWMDGVEDTQVDSSGTIEDMGDLVTEWGFWQRISDGSPDRGLDCILDDIIFADEPWTSEEIDDDYNRQPWS